MAFGSEVGTGHVSIFPSMKGFRSAVDKEMRGGRQVRFQPFLPGVRQRFENRQIVRRQLQKGIRFECPGRRRRCAETVEA